MGVDRASRNEQASPSAGRRPGAACARDGGLAWLQQRAGNRALSALLAPRPAQRAVDDEGSLGDDAAAAWSGLQATGKQSSSWINQGLDVYGKGAERQEQYTHDQLYGAADAVSGVPVLGSAAQGLAASLDVGNKVVGGVGEGLVDLAGGLMKGVADPISMYKGLGSMASRLPMTTMIGAAGDAASDLATTGSFGAAESDIARGAEKSVGDVFGGLGEGAGANGAMPRDAGLLRGLLDPFYKDVGSGRYAHAVGRGIADLGSAVVGGELVEGAGVAEAAGGGESLAAVEGGGGSALAEGAGAEGAELVPDTLPEPVPDTLPDGVPETVPEPVPDTVPDTVPEPAPDTIPDAAPDTLPDGVPRKPSRWEDPSLGEPQPYRGPEPNDPEISPLAESVPAPPGEIQPPISPAAESVPSPPGPVQAPVGPVSEPIPSGPATVDPDRVLQDFEQAWKGYSDEPFGYEILP